MEVPVGFLEKLWSFLSFLPFFLLLFLLGLLKAAVVSPLVVVIIVVGNSVVVIGLWPAHAVCTYYCVARTKRLGLILKILVLLLLPVPLILCPVVGVLGSLLGALGYGVFAPLIATFEAVGENLADKFYHCFADGCWSTIEGSCTVVRDFTDFCFHSYFSFMDELREALWSHEKPVDVKLLKLPGCLLASLVGVLVDVIPITLIALWKSPYMLFRGWKRLLEDLIGREGPFLETVCVPFAGLAIILWPLAVVGALVASFISSFFLGLYSGVIVHQEDSFQMGLAYAVAIVSLFDEYVNDMLYLREGSCLPRFGCGLVLLGSSLSIIGMLIFRQHVTARPDYHRNTKPRAEKESVNSTNRNELKSLRREGSFNPIFPSQQSRTLRGKIQQYKPVQVWDWLFKSCEVNGRILLREGLIDNKDIEDCIVRGNCKKLGIKLPTWTILQCLLASAKFDSLGLLISEDVELTRANGPREGVFEWFIGPLLIMKEQVKGLELSEDEEMCLRNIVMRYKNERPEDWDGTGFPSMDSVRRAQLQAIVRRLQGIVASMSRLPTFRRRFRNLVKVLYVGAIASNNRVGGVAIPVVEGGDQSPEEAVEHIPRYSVDIV